MTAKQSPPTHADTAWMSLCSCLQSLREDPGLETQRETVLQAMECLAPRVTPDWTAIQAIFSAASGEALKIFARAHGLEPLEFAAGRSRSALLSAAIREGDVDILLAWGELGLKVEGCGDLFLTRVMEEDDPDMWCVYRKLRRNPQRNWFITADLANACGPRLAPHLLEYLQQWPREQLLTADRLAKATPHGLKFFATILCLMARGKPAALNDIEMRRLPGALRPLAEKLSSRHGLLALRALEPDPEAILRRPESARFFGLDASAIS